MVATCCRHGPPVAAPPQANALMAPLYGYDPSHDWAQLDTITQVCVGVGVGVGGERRVWVWVWGRGLGTEKGLSARIRHHSCNNHVYNAMTRRCWTDYDLT